MSVQNRSAEAPQFNVFKIIRRGHYEVTTHSRLLGELLDPKGSHEQGNLFLIGFLDLLLSKKPAWKFPKGDHQWTIKLENDFMDIVLSHPKPQTRIIIENKWSAPDRKGQLIEYWRRRRDMTQLHSIPAVYLTPDGHRPLECQTIKERRFLEDLVILSYAHDIRTFLDDATRQVKSTKVCETVYQYIQLMEGINEN
jgi:hypothetical protein